VVEFWLLKITEKEVQNELNNTFTKE
jgi:hypothetical protein